MSIASRIEAIEQHLTDDYSVLEVAGADLTNVDKNILNLKPTWQERLLYFMNNGTDVVWNNWEKVTGTGETLTLNSTEEAPMKINLKGNTSQEGTPTPEAPQDIHVVSGDNIIKVEGKNLADYDNNTNLENKVLNASGVFESSPYTYVNGTIKVNNNKITISFNNRIGYSYVRIGEYKIDGTFIKRTLVTTTPTTLTLDSNTSYIIYSIDKRSGVYFDKFQIEMNDQATSYEPYQGNTYNIDLPVENLFDKDNANYVNGWIDGTTMRLNTINGNRMFYIPCKPNTTYTISRSVITSSFRTTTYDSTPFPTVTSSNVDYTVPTVIQNNSGTTLTITTNANAKYLVVHYGKIEDTNLNEMLATIQVEYGSKQNSYTPYGTTPIELCKIGDYQDSIKKSTGKNLCNGINQNVYLNNVTNQCGVADNNSGLYIQVSGGNYTISTTKTQERYRVACSNNEPSGVAQTAYVGKNKDNTSNSITIDTTGYSYLIVNATDLSAIQIEKGSSSSSYEPYGKVWYLNKQIGKVVFDGSENWILDNPSSQGIRQFTLVKSGVFYTSSSEIHIFSNYFKGVGWHNSWLYDNVITTGSYANTSRIRVMASAFSTVNDFKIWLSTHNTTAYYVLATPTYTEITDSTLLSQLEALNGARSYTTQTNISQENNDKPFILDVTALKQLTQ